MYRKHMGLPTMDEVYALRGPATIDRIEVRNFKSIRHAVLAVGAFTVLIGRNGAGKSNVVDAFRFVADSVSLGLITAIERRGGIRAVRHHTPKGGHPRTVALAIKLRFPQGIVADYEFQLKPEAGGDYSVGSEICRLTSATGEEFFSLKFRGGEVYGTPVFRVSDERTDAADFMDFFIRQGGFDPQLLALPVIAPIPGLGGVMFALRNMRSYAIVPDRLRELQDPDEGRILHPDGRNATSVLRGLSKERKQELLALLGHAVPGIEDVKSLSQAKKLTFEFTERTPAGRNRFEAHQMSDGTLRLFGILLAVLQPGQPSFMAIEEPESTIHVAALQTLFEVLRAHSDLQMLVTTHSSDILDFVDIEELRLVESGNGQSVVAGPAEYSKDAVREQLFNPGELYRAGALTQGSLFGSASR